MMKPVGAMCARTYPETRGTNGWLRTRLEYAIIHQCDFTYVTDMAANTWVPSGKTAEDMQTQTSRGATGKTLSRAKLGCNNSID